MTLWLPSSLKEREEPYVIFKLPALSMDKQGPA